MKRRLTDAPLPRPSETDFLASAARKSLTGFREQRGSGPERRPVLARTRVHASPCDVLENSARNPRVEWIAASVPLRDTKMSRETLVYRTSGREAMNGSVKNVSDRELLRRLNELVGRERHVEADLLLHLGEVEARRLYLEEGCSSMYGYCVDVLHFSEGVAGQRIRAARVARRFPLLLERLRRGEVHLAGVSVLATHLTKENHVELLERARHKTRNAIEEIVADLAPKPDAPSLVRKLPEPVPVSAPSAAGSTASAVRSAPEPARYERRTPEPLGQKRYKIQLTAVGSSATSCARRRRCSATRSRTGRSPRSSIGRSRCWWKT